MKVLWGLRGTCFGKLKKKVNADVPVPGSQKIVRFLST